MFCPAPGARIANALGEIRAALGQSLPVGERPIECVARQRVPAENPIFMCEMRALSALNPAEQARCRNTGLRVTRNRAMCAIACRSWRPLRPDRADGYEGLISSLCCRPCRTG